MAGGINSLKLWEIEGCYHCSIIGTSLTLKEVRRILKRAGFDGHTSGSDYHLHSILVKASHEKNEISKAAQKMLERKFKFTISKYYRASTEDELDELWEEALESGSLAEAYWAILSHPVTTERLRDRVFGDIHILSHLNGTSGNEEARKLKEMEAAYNKAEKARLFFRGQLKESKRMIKTLEERDRQASHLEEEQKKLEARLKELEDSSLSQKGAMIIKKLEEQLELTQAKEQADSQRLLILTEKLKKLSLENGRLRTALLNSETAEVIREEAGEQVCREIGGKCILYVGGRNSLIPRCREIVEQQGGGFIFHDGGIEQSTSRLSEVLSKVDIVMCPLDCISHDACRFVKKSCKRHQKKLILLKKSGVSSFRRGLDRINTTENISVC